MHPQIRQAKPGKCPICLMDLVEAETSAAGDRQTATLTLSPAARSLAEVRTEPVRRRYVTRRLRLAGKVDFDETRLATITARFAGRLERLYVDSTGVRVREGDHLATVYSPALLTAQQELLDAVRAVAEVAGSPSDLIRRTSAATVVAAREKLRLWGLTAEQVARIEAEGKPADAMTIHAPIGGIVTAREAVEGAYVETGAVLFRIADLSRLWVLLEAYESDLVWLRHGQGVSFEAEAHPGEAFEGLIAFIAPVLDERTRTVRVRVNVPNPGGRLKPGMFVRAVVAAEMAAGNRVRSTFLAGKFLCPMHPEQVRDVAGACGECGMALVPAVELGYAEAEGSHFEMPLVIPATAPLLTGERAVVYIASPDEAGVFHGREVVLGPRAGDWYVVHGGLHEGERVVVNGSFRIDSALQILARPSMMAAEGSRPAWRAAGPPAIPEDEVRQQPLAVDAVFTSQLAPLFDGYLATHRGLSGDDPEAARAAAAGLPERLALVDMSLLAGPARGSWMSLSARIRGAAEGVAAASDLAGARLAFEALSAAMIRLGRLYGTGLRAPLRVVRCPMAFDNRGADWLQHEGEIANPYYGAGMLRCGEATSQVPAAGGGDGG
ncbi:MAG: efflux RND transporter periplasmic adaptor subunit [Lentisphaeria bacterium]|nr:efflux RND transporter periplasmic adaptor subunit [Lentisphaeria bacterium]